MSFLNQFNWNTKPSGHIFRKISNTQWWSGGGSGGAAIKEQSTNCVSWGTSAATQ